MSYIKNKFDEFIDTHGHKVIVKHTDKKQSCPLPPKPKDNIRSQSHDSHKLKINEFGAYHVEDLMCPHCYGLNNLYSYRRTITRRGEANSQYGERLEMSDKIPHSGNTYDYYFKPHVDIDKEDFIIEYRENDYRLYVVINTDKHYGDRGVFSFRSALVAEVYIDEEVIKQSLKEMVYR